ncbi:MAG: TonB-dependent receptor [Planctomycetes bacterium]|nr:TonB-dependent receptor [Planctomycetota bacterium]
MRMRCLWIYLAASLALALSAARSEDLTPDKTSTVKPPVKSDFGDLSIEELMNIKVTSVSRKEEKVSDTAAAITVITAEDIRRSGVTSIAEALRMAPGVNVAKIDSHTYAISIRGFQSGLANKLLVLIDGRCVYSPLYSGVYWDVQDTMLEDIERIEVIRGPGATVWGANAVNGVVNIITKHSKDTQGVTAALSAGTQETTIDSVRYGGKIGAAATYRFFVKYSKAEELGLAGSGLAAHDGWSVARGGTRFDIKASRTDSVIVEGDYYKGVHEEKQLLAQLTPPFEVGHTHDASMSGGDALVRWGHNLSDTSNTSLQLYYDHTERDELKLDQDIDTLDLDFSHHIKLSRNEIVYGLGYRRVRENLNQTFTAAFDPDGRATDLFSFFGQDEITVLKDTFFVTVGSKFEHNSFTGWEIQPSVKTLWRPAKDQTVWASVSRSVRTSAPTETDLRANLLASKPFFFLPPIVAALFPNRDIPSEAEYSYELGCRAQLHKRFSLDAAGFFNQYHGLRSNEAGAFFVERLPLPLHITVPITQQADMRGETYGGEFSANWDPIDRVKFSAGYSFLKILLHKDSNARAKDAEIAEGQTPEHQFQFRSLVDLPHNLQFDTAVYFDNRLKSIGFDSNKNEAIDSPSYTRLDVRLGWRPTEHLDLSVGGQNLLKTRHEEFGPGSSEIERNVYLKLTLKF